MEGFGSGFVAVTNGEEEGRFIGANESASSQPHPSSATTTGFLFAVFGFGWDLVAEIVVVVFADVAGVVAAVGECVLQVFVVAAVSVVVGATSTAANADIQEPDGSVEGVDDRGVCFLAGGVLSKGDEAKCCAFEPKSFG